MWHSGLWLPTTNQPTFKVPLISTGELSTCLRLPYLTCCNFRLIPTEINGMLNLHRIKMHVIISEFSGTSNSQSLLNAAIYKERVILVQKSWISSQASAVSSCKKPDTVWSELNKRCISWYNLLFSTASALWFVISAWDIFYGTTLFWRTTLERSF